MGSKWFTGGVVAAPSGRIQFDFIIDGVRYRPSIKRPPSEGNLRRARERLQTIKEQIRLGTFSFEEEFPDYRFMRRLSGAVSARLEAIGNIDHDHVFFLDSGQPIQTFGFPSNVGTAS